MISGYDLANAARILQSGLSDVATAIRYHADATRDPEPVDFRSLLDTVLKNDPQGKETR